MNTVATKNTGGHLTCHCGIISLPWVKIRQITEQHPVDMCVEEEKGLGREGGRDREAERWIHQIVTVLSLVRRSVMFYIFL